MTIGCRVSRQSTPAKVVDRFWTYSVFNEVPARCGAESLVTPVSRHYPRSIRSTLWYQNLVAIGIGDTVLYAPMVGLPVNC